MTGIFYIIDSILENHYRQAILVNKVVRKGILVDNYRVRYWEWLVKCIRVAFTLSVSEFFNKESRSSMPDIRIECVIIENKPFAEVSNINQRPGLRAVIDPKFSDVAVQMYLGGWAGVVRKIVIWLCSVLIAIVMVKVVAIICVFHTQVMCCWHRIPSIVNWDRSH